jgi:nucleoside-diphosphate-sugar epimerase
MQAFTKKRITVFGGSQTRPNIHIQDMIGVYLHMLDQGDSLQGIYNAGFENLSILDIAKRASDKIQSEIVMSDSDDPRSYRLNSGKLLSTGYEQKYSVNDAMNDVISALREGKIKDSDQHYNIRTMKRLHVNA